jgi:hypothetical protein
VFCIVQRPLTHIVKVVLRACVMMRGKEVGMHGDA